MCYAIGSRFNGSVSVVLDMAKTRNPLRFTRKETIARLQAAKSYLGDKERLAFMRTKSVYLPEGYKPTEDESFYCAPRLSSLDIQCLTDEAARYCGYNWRANDECYAGDSIEFTAHILLNAASIGQVVVIFFYPWVNDKATKVAALWLGTWHHAPVVAWSDGSKVSVDFLPQYIDLIH